MGTNAIVFDHLARQTVVEAHHRGLREPNREVFAAALQQVWALTKDARLAARAKMYLANE